MIHILPSFAEKLRSKDLSTAGHNFLSIFAQPFDFPATTRLALLATRCLAELLDFLAVEDWNIEQCSYSIYFQTWIARFQCHRKWYLLPRKLSFRLSNTVFACNWSSCTACIWCSLQVLQAYKFSQVQIPQCPHRLKIIECKAILGSMK